MQIIRLRLGDCVEAMESMEESSVDAVVCDPPYGLEFMGKEWDRLGDIGKATGEFSKGAKAVKGIRGEIKALPSYKPSGNVRCRNCGKWKIGHVPGDGGGGGLACLCENPDFPNTALVYSKKMQTWHLAWLREAHRILQPGGLIKAFSGTRTFHRLAMAMEQVGFEIVPLDAWCYGSGFPKSLNVGKAIDKQGGKHGATLRAFCAYVNEARLTQGLSNREIDEALGLKSGGASANHWMTHPTQPRFPRKALYERLKKLLGIDGRFDQAIEEYEREVVGTRAGFKAGSGVAYGGSGGWSSKEVAVSLPGSPTAVAWDGWGTALKPGWEPVLVGRKPE